MTNAITIECSDGFRLGGEIWGEGNAGTVVINPATGVLARYYHFYARFLAEHGFRIVTFDYRGIGASRPARLGGIRWIDWGRLDIDAVLRWVLDQGLGRPLIVVGHSIGGFLPGFAAAAPQIDRMLTMGAQYAWLGDYQAGRRLRLIAKWHVIMPLLTLGLGYFPGKRLGWLEDLPAGVALEWSLRRPRMERSYPRSARAAILDGFAAVRAPILAVGLSDDEFGTQAAIGRALGYYTGAERHQVELTPADFGADRIGHFGLFHARHRAGFWQQSLSWLRDGVNPWPAESIAGSPYRR